MKSRKLSVYVHLAHVFCDFFAILGKIGISEISEENWSFRKFTGISEISAVISEISEMYPGTWGIRIHYRFLPISLSKFRKIAKNRKLTFVSDLSHRVKHIILSWGLNTFFNRKSQNIASLNTFEMHFSSCKYHYIFDI